MLTILYKNLILNLQFKIQNYRIINFKQWIYQTVHRQTSPKISKPSSKPQNKNPSIPPISPQNWNSQKIKHMMIIIIFIFCLWCKNKIQNYSSSYLDRRFFEDAKFKIIQINGSNPLASQQLPSKTHNLNFTSQPSQQQRLHPMLLQKVKI